MKMRKRKPEGIELPTEVRVLRPRTPRVRGGVLHRLQGLARRGFAVPLAAPFIIVSLQGCGLPLTEISLAEKARIEELREATMKAGAETEEKHGRDLTHSLTMHRILSKLGLMKKWPKGKPITELDLMQVEFQHPRKSGKTRYPVPPSNCGICHGDEKGTAYRFPHPDSIRQALKENRELSKEEKEKRYNAYLAGYVHFYAQVEEPEKKKAEGNF